jgi:hypothetical protein
MIFEHPFFAEMLLPFLLIFVITFAILQKSKILGEGKAQIDAIVSFVIGLILIISPGPRDMIVNILPWMAVGIAVILTFLILYGFVAGDLSGDKFPKKLKIGFGILAGIFVVAVVLAVTGLGSKILGTFTGDAGSALLVNILMIGLVVGAVIVAIVGGKKTGDKKKGG